MNTINPLNKISLSIELMTRFASETGLSQFVQVQKRYLWTDAFAVCNFFELYKQTGDLKYKYLALKLINQVHNILGKHREDDSRSGWISGLKEEAGNKHPTVGGLRIGKSLKERKPSEPINEILEWERDGQYYHYLTKWMHALNRASLIIKDPMYNRWAIELAKTAHAAFTYTSPLTGKKRIYWKMNIDLSRPLVDSMGQHDPLDGLVTYQELEMTAKLYSRSSKYTSLKKEILDMEEIVKDTELITEDPLGIGGLLFDAGRIAQMIKIEYLKDTDLLLNLLQASLIGLRSFIRSDTLNILSDYRLAFRELGLSIGLHAVFLIDDIFYKIKKFVQKYQSIVDNIQMLRKYTSLIETIEDFWLKEQNQQARTWIEHREINMVMLAASLTPTGFLSIMP